MKYWIMKTEPSTYSFDDLLREKGTSWTGVRNYQARNNLRLAKKGDFVLIYHSGDEKATVGLAKVTSEAYKEAGVDGDWVAIDIAPVKKLARPVTLKEFKADKILKSMVLVRNSRLSVSPLSEKEYEKILNMSEKR